MPTPTSVTICAEDESHRYILCMKADEFLAMNELRALQAISVTGRFEEVDSDEEWNTRFKMISESLLEARKALLSQK